MELPEGRTNLDPANTRNVRADERLRHQLKRVQSQNNATAIIRPKKNVSIRMRLWPLGLIYLRIGFNSI